MGQIELHGKYAVGDRKFALIDDDDFDRLNRWRWRVKPSRNTAYAVRLISAGPGTDKQHQVLMHREILGLKRGDPLETDHANHNGLDNRRVNLASVTTKENQKNRILREHVGVCARCGVGFKRLQRASRPILYCSEKCSALASDSLGTKNGEARANRLVAAFDKPASPVEIANRCGLHIVSVWRLLPQLVEHGRLRLINKNPHIYAKPGWVLANFTP